MEQQCKAMSKDYRDVMNYEVLRMLKCSLNSESFDNKTDYSGGNVEWCHVLLLGLSSRVNVQEEINSDYFFTLFNKTEN